MRFSKPDCPTCGEEANGILEKLYAWAHIDKAKDGSFQYIGQSKVDWDSQEPDEENPNEVYLKCCQKHEWKSKVDFTDQSTPVHDLIGESTDGEEAEQADG